LGRLNSGPKWFYSCEREGLGQQERHGRKKRHLYMNERMDGEHLLEINKIKTFNRNSFNVWVDPLLLMVKKKKNGEKLTGRIYMENTFH
jgi:hypothetical protein